MQPNYTGVYAALVTNNSDPTHSKRIRAQVPQISAAAELNWATSVNSQQPVPAVNTIVYVVFNGGDLTKPMYFPNSVAAFPAIPELAVILDWTTPVLASGYTENGNTNGTVMYRVVDILGTRQVQWQGGLNLTYPGGNLANTAQPFTLPINSLAWPTSSTIRSCTAPCSTSASLLSSLKLDTNSSGVCQIVGTNTTTIQPPWVSFNGVSYFL